MSDDQPPPMSRPRVAAGALFFDDQGRVLLVKPTYKPGWDIPGGYVEPAETPLQACHREVREELGLERETLGLLAVDWAPSEQDGDKILFVFDGGQLDEDDARAITLPAQELGEVEFASADAFDALMPARLARRIQAAVGARDAGAPVYLEHGR